MEFNLPEANCTEFSFSSQFTSTEHVHYQIGLLMKETALMFFEDSDLEIAPYGSIYNVGDTTIGIAGNLHRNVEGKQASYWLHIRYLVGDEDFPSPPNDWKPASELFKIAADLIGEVVIYCEATFVYELREGFRSRVALPSPLLLVDQGSDYTLTHIESVVLSSREEDLLAYTVKVEPSGDGSSISHTVNFSTNSILNLDSIQQMFEVASQISMILIDHQPERIQ